MKDHELRSQIIGILSRVQLCEVNAAGEAIIEKSADTLLALITAREQAALTAQNKRLNAEFEKRMKREVGTTIEKFIENGWGKRCKSKDTDDFPDLKDTDNRCACCEMWEYYDDYVTSLKSQKGQTND